ncbi:MAG: hypothetical protein ACRDIV_09595 [Ktedonobacteraceae bacterium]
MSEWQNRLHRLWRVYLVSYLPAVGQLVVLVIVATALLWPAPFQPNELPGTWTALWSDSDLLMNHLPTALLIQRTFAQGHGLPLWNPYFGGGQPLAADPLAALFYPPTHLVHFFSLRNYYLVLIMGHLIFAGLGMLLLARRAFKLSRLAALTAAVAFMATPRLLSHLGAGHVTILQTVAWFPWLALACWATVRNPRRWSAVFGFCLAMAVLAGHPQMIYYGLMMVAGLSIWLLVMRWRQEGRRAFLMSAAGLAVAGLIGVLLASVYLLPVMEFTARSTRQLSVSSMDGYPLRHFIHELVDPNPAPQLPWEGMVTPGLVVLGLALIAVVTRLRKAWPIVLGIALVAGLTMGNESPLYHLAAKVLPDYDLFRGLARIWFVALVLFALLGGLGADSILRGVRRIWSRGTIVAGLLIVLIVAVSLVNTDKGYAQVGNVTADTTPSALARVAAQMAGNGRIYAVQRNLHQVNAVDLQVPLADGWNPLLIQSYVSYMQDAGGYTFSGYQLTIPAFDASVIQPRAILLGYMNISVVLSRRPMTDSHLVLAGKEDGTLIYKNTANAGPAFLVMPGPDGNPPSLNHVQRMSDTVRTLTLTPEQQTFSFSASAAGYLVIAMPQFPGWNVELDGHPVSTSLFAATMPAIQVGAGTHTVSYTYAPSSVRNGAILSGVGLLAMFVGLYVGFFWKPRKRRAGKEERSEDEDMTSTSSDEQPESAASLVGEKNMQ